MEEKTFVTELNELIPEHLNLQLRIFDLFDKYRDKDLKKFFYAGHECCRKNRSKTIEFAKLLFKEK